MVAGALDSDFGAHCCVLATHWLRDQPDVRHRRLHGVLMSADLSGFTAMSERLAVRGKEGAEILTDIVNSAFTTLIDAADREGGDVLKFGGDAVLVWFEGKAAAERAARASARMQHSLGAPRFANVGVRASIGAHQDDFDFFLVGRPDWRELVVTGRPVTRTVALESAAQAGQVFISAELAAELPATWLRRENGGDVELDLATVPRPRRHNGRPHNAGAPELVPPRLHADVRALANLGGEHRIASAVFLEALGVDARLAEHGPERMSGDLDALVRRLQDLSDQVGMHVLCTDVLADGIKIIATAGAPTTTPDDESNALRFAVELVQGDSESWLKAGVNRGRVFAGFLGSPVRHNYTLMGDSVNLAARLMSHAESGQVVAARAMVDESRMQFRTTALPPFMVKGKSEPIDAVVVGAATDVQRAAKDHVPLVGRQAELSLLRRLVGEVVAGTGHAVEVSGAAGVGKSRLVHEAVADDRRLARVVVECQAYERHSPYAAARVLLRRALGIPQDVSPDSAGAMLDATVQRHRPSLAGALPLIAVTIEAAVSATPEADAVAPEFRAARTHEAVVELLTAALPDPTILLVEDAYYADAASVDLFAAIAEQVAERPWLLLATRRPDTSSLFVADRGTHVIDLSPLEPEHASELAALAMVDVEPDELAAMAERAGGNPLFVLQLAGALQAGVSAEDLPESVERVIAAQLDWLSPQDRALVRHAAVLGSQFDDLLLASLLRGNGQPDPDEQVWARLATFVEPASDGGRRFRHLLYRDVAYQGLPYKRRTALHQQVGELLEAVSGTPDLNLLSEHFARAGDAARTWRYSVGAADRAWANQAIAESIAAYSRALAVRRKLPGLARAEVARVYEDLGDVLERAAQYDPADDRYAAAARLIDGTDLASTARVLRKRGDLRERAGKYRLALRWYERGLNLLGDRPELQLDAPLLAASAAIMHRMGRIEDQMSLASLAAERAVLGGDRVTEARAHMLLQTAVTFTGNLTDLDHGQRALALYAEIGDTLHQGKVLNNLGVAQYFSGDWQGASERWELAAERFEAAGDLVSVATVRNNLAEILSDRGRADEAIPLFASALSAWRKANYPLGCAIALSNIGRAHARAGRSVEAIASLETAQAELIALKSDDFVVETTMRLCEAHLLAGNRDRAEELLESAAAVVSGGGGFPGSDATIARLRVWMLRQQGEHEQAIIEARQAVRFAERADARFERVMALNEVAILTRDRSVAAEVAAELAALGVLRLPKVPVASGRLVAGA